MPKVRLEYNLPDEQNEYFQASNGAKFHSVLWDVTHEFRQRWKYNTARECTWDEVWDLLWSIYQNNNFDPYQEE